jgi:hypothetical protein
MQIVHDVTDYQIHFFAIPLEREPEKFRALCEFLNTAVASFAVAVGKEAPYPIQLDVFRQRVSDRLALVVPTRTPSGFELELDVRTLHDAVFLRARSLRKGALKLEQVKAHRSVIPLPHPDTDLPSYVGALRVLYVESDEQDGSQRAVVGEQLASDGDFPWLAEAEPIVTELGAMHFGAPRPLQNSEAPVLDLIFVGGRDTAAQAEHAKYPRHPFLVTLPELALCHLKVRNSAESLESTWLPKMAECDRELRDLFPRRGQRISTLEQMRSRNDDITTRQADLVDALVNVRAHLRTMRTNRDNFLSASAEAFPAIARRLRQSLIDFWVHGTELQADNDIEYAEGTLQRAENHFRSIEATAAVYQAQELTKIYRWQIRLAGEAVLVALIAAIIALVGVINAWKSPATSSSPASATQRAIGASTKSP